MPARRVKVGPTQHLSTPRGKGGKATPQTQKAPDANATPSLSKKRIKTNMFPSLTGGKMGGSESTSTEPSSDEEGKAKGNGSDGDGEEDDGDDDDDDGMEWEDVFHATIEPASVASIPSSSSRIGGDLHLTLDNNINEFSTSKKKGASAKERQIRVVTHCLHVQSLLFHGSIRNRWLCDPEVHAILLSHLTPSIMKDIEKFQNRQGNKQEKATVSKGLTDPILKLLGVLIHWWKKKFTINKPGMRKSGYRTLKQFRDEKEEEEGEKFRFINGNKGLGGEDKFTLIRDQGERVDNLEGFRGLARECKGSRDIGAMLFTALLRAIGFDSRMVFSLQPLGFGFTERENFTGAEPVKQEGTKVPQKKTRSKGKRKSKAKDIISSDEESGDDNGYGSDASGGFVREKTDLSHKPKQPIFDKDLPYPIFWSEVYSTFSEKWITVESLVLTVLGSTLDLLANFEPKGKRAAASKQTIAYVIAYSANGTAKDVTVRYLAKNTFPGKTKGFRIPITNIPVYDYEGKVVGTQKRDWFDGVMRGYRTPENLLTENEKKEDEELKAFVSKEKVKVGQKESISYYKNNPDYVLGRHLKRDEAVKSGKGYIKTFTTGKGEKSKEEKVYSKDDIVTCKTVENWWREGRVVKEGQQALKRVKPRASTLNKKREIDDAKRDGETVLEGLYSEEQTKLYCPLPIVDGKILRNSFGNIDIYVPSMIPPGAIHLPLKGTGKLARKLGIDYAEAVTGFEFKKQRAVPYIEGIIIAAGNEDLMRDAWRAEQEETKRRADVKREKAALAMWQRFLMGLRIVKHLRDEYGDEEDGAVDANPFTKKSHKVIEGQYAVKSDQNKGAEEEEGGGRETGGGLIRGDGSDFEESGGFIRGDGISTDEGGGFEVILDGDQSTALREGNLPADSPPHSGVMSFHDIIAQKGREIDEESANSDSGSEQEVAQISTLSLPVVRSGYFSRKPTNHKSKVPEVTSDPEDGLPKQLSWTGYAGPPRTKTRIEVQTPVRARLGRKAEMSKGLEVSVAGGALDTPMLRSSKRKATVEADERQSKYFVDDGEDLGSGRLGEKRKRGKVMKRQ